ncbi:hypothetical protein L6452_09598 [Arctium lappa]|uniref:Uncharacterized protein n=1 Tax=Arctium lappa TaxID=4217 RepID=A0ACB9DKX9_ARCLA|nr:hypothetical protein L6452_09598 [Arctium lappa]
MCYSAAGWWRSFGVCPMIECCFLYAPLSSSMVESFVFFLPVDLGDLCSMDLDYGDWNSDRFGFDRRSLSIEKLWFLPSVQLLLTSSSFSFYNGCCLRFLPPTDFFYLCDLDQGSVHRIWLLDLN